MEVRSSLVSPDVLTQRRSKAKSDVEVIIIGATGIMYLQSKGGLVYLLLFLKRLFDNRFVQVCFFDRQVASLPVENLDLLGSCFLLYSQPSISRRVVLTMHFTCLDPEARRSKPGTASLGPPFG